MPVWADSLTRWLDDAIRIPGTNFGIGLDAIIGFLVPGLGDAATGVASLALLALALQRGVPRVVLARMIMNIGLDAMLGAVPVLGDVFDVAFRANRKNLELIKRHEGAAGREKTAVDYLFVGAGVLLVLLAIALPIVLVTYVTGKALHGLWH